MTQNQQDTLIDMLRGAYLIKTRDSNKRPCYKLYTGNNSPLRYIKNSHLPPWDCLKVSKSDPNRIGLSRRTIQGYHGKSIIKKLYLKYRKDGIK